MNHTVKTERKFILHLQLLCGFHRWLSWRSTKYDMKRKIITSLILLPLVWLSGLLISYNRTEKHTSDFYQWLCETGGTPKHMDERPLEFRHDLIFPISDHELLKKMDVCERPFKKHLSLPNVTDVNAETLHDEYVPRHYYLTRNTIGCSGTYCIRGISLTGSFFVSQLRTQDGGFGIVIRTKLFGI
jgi:hypothetical protein